MAVNERVRASNLKPIINIGKNGVTEGMILLIKRELEQKGTIKIRVLRSIKDARDDIINDVLKRTKSILVNSIGNTFTIRKS